MSPPPTLGPMILVKLKAAEFSATAFISSARGTMSGMSACRTGSLKDHTVPVASVKANRCQTSSHPMCATRAMARAVPSTNHWVVIIILRRSERSAATPASGLKMRKGTNLRPLMAPRRMDERVIS